MNFRREKTLRFWVHCSYEDQRYDTSDRTRNELFAESCATTNNLAMRCGI
jgi:hypothetical protein